MRQSTIAQSRLGAGWASVLMQTRLEYQDPLRLSGDAHKKEGRVWSELTATQSPDILTLKGGLIRTNEPGSRVQVTDL